MYARISAWFLVLTLALAGNASAQERFGTLQGRVADQQGAAIPGVTVSVTSLSSGDTRTFVTDANGQYVASDLNPGRYKVSSSSPASRGWSGPTSAWSSGARSRWTPR